MKERPIIFNADQVRAILDGEKTQTRRVIKPQPTPEHKWHGWIIESSNRKDDGKSCWALGDKLEKHKVRCPYGSVGDRLWLRQSRQVTLDIKSVGVERLQDISEQDAWAEGFLGWDDDVTGGCTARGDFAQYWESLHGTESWDSNPWVWVIEFERVDQ